MPPQGHKIRSIALTLHQQHVLLVAARKLPGRWVLPGGTLEPGETLVAAAEREVLEETGVAVHAGRLVAYRELFWKDRDAVEVYFLAELVGEMAAPGGGIEQRSARWQPLDALGELPIVPESLPDLCAHILSGAISPLYLGAVDLRHTEDAR
jgi:8-oxo-dGTP pyrophosphatase MutT (NUDIX family)